MRTNDTRPKGDICEKLQQQNQILLPLAIPEESATKARSWECTGRGRRNSGSKTLDLGGTAEEEPLPLLFAAIPAAPTTTLTPFLYLALKSFLNENLQKKFENFQLARDRKFRKLVTLERNQIWSRRFVEGKHGPV